MLKIHLLGEKGNLSQFFDVHVERHPLLWPVTQTTYPRISPEEEGEPITTFQRPPGRLVSYSWLQRPHVQLFLLVEMGNLSRFFGIVPDCSQIHPMSKFCSLCGERGTYRKFSATAFLLEDVRLGFKLLVYRIPWSMALAPEEHLWWWFASVHDVDYLCGRIKDDYSRRGWRIERCRSTRSDASFTRS
jgi:hypothetical protein